MACSITLEDIQVEQIDYDNDFHLSAIKTLWREYSDSIEVDISESLKEEIPLIKHGKFSPKQQGVIILALDKNGKIPVGTVALMKLNWSINECELKRMYIRPRYRNKKIGEKLVNAVIQKANEYKYNQIRLDTLPSWKAAQKLYQKMGFIECMPYPNELGKLGQYNGECLYFKRNLLSKL
eukprot:180645_1